MASRRVAGLAAGWALWLAVAPAVHGEEDWPAVIAELRAESARRPGFSRARQQLAIALNNYGVSLAGTGDWQSAKDQLREAMRLDADNPRFTTNLAGVHLTEAHDHFQRREIHKARAAAEEAARLDPTLAQARALLGEIEYAEQDLEAAQAAWQQAIELDPGLPEVRKRLEQVAQELPLESSFDRISQSYFDLRYEDHLERPRGFDIRNALLAARRDVGADFAYWPRYKIVVLIYSAESFRALRQETPEWVGGQYDGKIRVPLPDNGFDDETVKQIVFHEYAHALVHDVSNGRCPVWFNEGIAEYEGRKYGPQRLEALASATVQERLIPWEHLSGQFSPGLPVQQVALGYQQSYSIVRYLVERYGFWRIRRILKALGEGETLATLLDREFHLKAARLERNWRAWLPKILPAS